jgi:Ca-activated chloride channel family protein
LFAFRRGGIAAALVLCALLPLSQPVQAQDGSLWRRADQQRHARIEQGVQAYRNGDFAAAEHAFSGIDSAEALYNKGNALAKQGRYDEAIEAYDAALRKQPDMEDAIANRRAVDAARKRQQQGKPNSQQQSPQNEPGKNQKKPGQDRQDPQDARPEQSDAGPAQSRQDEPSRPQDAKPQEAQQQAADAAQREKMEQAMRQPPQSGNAKPGEQAETPAQREKRQAIEAQLRRVPDDPGGLLRAKFRLEYERRMRERE